MGYRDSQCGDDIRIIACIEDPQLIWKILAHLDAKSVSAGTNLLPGSRGPPQANLLRKIHHANDLLQ